MNTQVSVKLVKDANVRKLLEYLLNKIKGFTSFTEAPINGNQYARQDGAWTEVEAPVDTTLVYYATLTTPSPGEAPDVYENKNTLGTGSTLNTNYIGVGIYECTLTLPEGYTIQDVHISFGNFIYDGAGGSVYCDGIDFTDGNLVFTLKTKSNVSTFADFLLASTPIKIELYT